MTSIIEELKKKSRSSRELSKIIEESVESSSFSKSEIRKTSSKMMSSDLASTEIHKLIRGLERLAEKKSELVELEQFIEGWILGLRESSYLKNKVIEGEERLRNEERIKEINSKIKYST